MKINKLVYSSMVVALAIVIDIIFALTPFLNFYLFGSKSLEVSFSDTLLIINGALFGPLSAIIAGFVYDFITFSVIGVGAYNPFFLISYIVIGLIPALLMKYIRFSKNNIISYIFLIFILFVFNFYFVVSKDSIGNLEINSIIKILLLIVTSLSVVVMLVLLFKVNDEEKQYSLFSCYVIVLLTSVVASLFINSYALTLYKIPFEFSFLIRVFKLFLLINIDSFILYALINKIDELVEE